jgi:hypothetical protein
MRGLAVTTIAYSQKKMAFNAIGCGVLSVLGAVAAFMPDWHVKIRFLGGFLALTLPFITVALVLRIKSGAAALRYDRQGLAVSTFWHRSDHPWSDVRAITRETLTQSSSFDLVKQDLAHYIVVTVADGPTLNEYKVQEELLDWPKGDMQAIVDDMSRHWEAALHGHRSPSTAPTEARGPAPQPTINGIPLAAASPAPSFGRKGL